MLKTLPPYCIPNGQTIENLELADWAWNSHFWIEEYKGYYKCKWCDRLCTSTEAITVDFPLCVKNPCLIKFKNS